MNAAGRANEKSSGARSEKGPGTNRGKHLRIELSEEGLCSGYHFKDRGFSNRGEFASPRKLTQIDTSDIRLDHHIGRIHCHRIHVHVLDKVTSQDRLQNGYGLHSRCRCIWSVSAELLFQRGRDTHAFTKLQPLLISTSAGMLLISPPSMSAWPSRQMGCEKTGRLMLSRTAFTASP